MTAPAGDSSHDEANSQENQDIAKYKLPEHLELFDELPKSAGGKISKVELRHEIIRRMTATTQ